MGFYCAPARCPSCECADDTYSHPVSTGRLAEALLEMSMQLAGLADEVPAA